MVIRVLGQVFAHVQYKVIASIVSFLILSAALVAPNYKALLQVLFSDTALFGVKAKFVLSLYGSLFTNFTWWTGFYLVLISILFGINIALLLYYIRIKKSQTKKLSLQFTTVGGFVSGILGVGCAACGSVILTAVLGTAGAGNFLVLLPLRGLEFGLVGLLLIGASTWYLIKKIHEPMICS